MDNTRNGVRNYSRFISKICNDENLFPLDRSGMAVGVEARVPFQDHRLVEFALKLPPDFLCRGGQLKALLRKSMEGRLPLSVLKNRNKIGFTFPYVELLRSNVKIRNLFLQLLAEMRNDNSGLWVHDSLLNNFMEICRGASHNYNIWRVFEF